MMTSSVTQCNFERLRQRTTALNRNRQDARKLSLKSKPPHIRLSLSGQPSKVLGVPVYYECQRCTACCRWPGDVRLAEGEIARLAAFKGMREVPFIQQFTRLTADRRGLSLQEKPNGECIFLDG